MITGLSIGSANNRGTVLQQGDQRGICEPRSASGLGSAGVSPAVFGVSPNRQCTVRPFSPERTEIGRGLPETKKRPSNSGKAGMKASSSSSGKRSDGLASSFSLAEKLTLRGPAGAGQAKDRDERKQAGILTSGFGSRFRLPNRDRPVAVKACIPLQWRDRLRFARSSHSLACGEGWRTILAYQRTETFVRLLGGNAKENPGNLERSHCHFTKRKSGESGNHELKKSAHSPVLRRLVSHNQSWEGDSVEPWLDFQILRMKVFRI